MNNEEKTPIIGRWVYEDCTRAWNEGRYEEGSTVFKFKIPFEWEMVFSNFPEDRDGEKSVPILEPSGKVYGYAVPGYYACFGKIYRHRNEIPEEEYFGETVERYGMAVKRARAQLQELEDDCYGD